MNIETNTTLEEEALAVLWRWSASRKKKNTVVEGSARILQAKSFSGAAGYARLCAAHTRSS
jgi:hypothetical protein